MTERRLEIQEVYDAHKAGRLDEAFGTGTAAVISPIGELNWEGNAIIINDGKTGKISHELYENLTGIQYGFLEDEFGWVVKV